MADEIAEQYARLQLHSEEEDVVDLSSSGSETVDETLGLRVMAKLLTDKPINFDALKRTMMNVWNLREGVLIRSIEINMFIF
ncbi:unnamed protein product [Amaranthus hypochondriacus]